MGCQQVGLEYANAVYKVARKCRTEILHLYTYLERRLCMIVDSKKTRINRVLLVSTLFSGSNFYYHISRVESELVVVVVERGIASTKYSIFYSLGSGRDKKTAPVGRFD